MEGGTLINQKEYLEEQYATKDNLQTRIRTHELYTEPKIPFVPWVLGHVSWRSGDVVVDVGCGSGAYSAAVQQKGCRYLALDISPGMLRDLPYNVREKANGSADHLPFRSGFADVILANHMLYHVSDISATLTEIKRVLREDGTLVAATNSKTNMAEFDQLARKLTGLLNLPPGETEVRFPAAVSGFSLENGSEHLQPFFSTVERHEFASVLVFREPQPVLDYVNSTRSRYEALLGGAVSWEEACGVLRNVLQEHIDRQGEYRVNKLTGVFICRR